MEYKISVNKLINKLQSIVAHNYNPIIKYIHTNNSCTNNFRCILEKVTWCISLDIIRFRFEIEEQLIAFNTNHDFDQGIGLFWEWTFAHFLPLKSSQLIHFILRIDW